MLKDKPIQQFGEVVESNTTEFQIDITPKLFEMLSGLYSNKIRAVIRELLCNAIDSHISAGIPDQAVNVILPTSEYPYLTIQDFGVGMSPECIVNVYTRYSKSTKMHDSATTGALGLGSKSPFCYTNLFTLESIYDGVKVLYNVYMNEKRIPALTEISRSESDDENGVTVTVPVKKDDYIKFAQELNFVLQHTTSPVDVFNKQDIEGEVTVVDLNQDFQRFKDLVAYTTDFGAHMMRSDPWRNSSTGCYILQANVIYPIQSHDLLAPLYDAALTSRITIVFEVKNGEVSFSPTREELSLDVDTITCIETRVKMLQRKAQMWAKMYARFHKNLDKTVLGKHPFWQYLYNYTKAKIQNLPSTWKATHHRVTFKRPDKWGNTYDQKRFPIPGWSVSQSPYKHEYTSIEYNDKIGFILNNKFVGTEETPRLSTTEMIQNYCRVTEYEERVGIIIRVDSYFELVRIMKRLSFRNPYTMIDESLYQEKYKKPRTPRTPVKTYTMDFVGDAKDGVYAVNTQECTVKDVDEYPYYMIRKNRSIVWEDENFTFEDSGRKLKYLLKLKGILGTLNWPVDEKNKLVCPKVLILTQTQHDRLKKTQDYQGIPLLQFIADDESLQWIYNISPFVKYYDDVDVDPNWLDQMMTAFSYDEKFVRCCKRIKLEFSKWNRFMKNKTSKFTNSPMISHPIIKKIHDSSYHRSNIRYMMSEITDIPLNTTRQVMSFGTDEECNRIQSNKSCTNYSMTNTLSHYFIKCHVPTYYDMDKESIILFNNYLSSLVKRDDRAFHILDILNKIAVKR